MSTATGHASPQSGCALPCSSRMDRGRAQAAQRGADCLDSTKAVDDADPPSKVIAARSSPMWLIEDYIEGDTIAVIAGAEGTYKSFSASDMALCIGHGLSLHTRRTVQPPVLYIAGEGRARVVRRIRGWLQYQ